MHRGSREHGFTLASLLVILTIISVMVAYTVPTAWSEVMKRERDYQTIWVMKQYARAIWEFQQDRKAMPTSLEQLKEHNTPRRVVRQLYKNPLSGEMDWIMVAPGQDQAAGGVAPGLQPPGLQPQQPQQEVPEGPRVDPMKYSGPFIGVRPPQRGPSIVTFNGKETYETWMYTINDLNKEINPEMQPTVPGGNTIVKPQ